jgi:hypothetical protein
MMLSVAHPGHARTSNDKVGSDLRKREYESTFVESVESKLRWFGQLEGGEGA